MKTELLSYWKNLNEREQWTLAIGGIFCGIYLFYLIIYSPLITAVATRNQQLQEKRETLVWMQQIQKQYRRPQQALQKISNSKLLSLIASELSSPSFKGFTYQMQQSGAGDIQLSFEQVPYNTFITWLWDMTHQYRLSIKELRIEHHKTPGLVKLTITL